MRISRRKIRQLILEAPDGKSGAVVTGGEDSNIDLRAMEGISNGIIPKVAKFLYDEAYLDSEDDRWAITFKMGSNSLLPIKKGKVPDIIWAGGQGSFGGKKLGDQTRDVKTLKRKLKPFLARLYAQEMGDKFRYIKWGKEIRISLRAGASIPHNTPIRGQGNQTVEAIAAATGEKKSTILNIAKEGGNTVVPGRGKSRGGGGTNKCVRELQEFLVSKKVEKTKGRSYTDKDIDGQWGKNTRYAFYYYLVNTEDAIPADRGGEGVTRLAEDYIENNNRTGWKKILETMALTKSYSGLCEFVKIMKEQQPKPKEEEESEEEKKKSEEEKKAEEKDIKAQEFYDHVLALTTRAGKSGISVDIERDLLEGNGIPVTAIIVPKGEDLSLYRKVAKGETAEDVTKWHDRTTGASWYNSEDAYTVDTWTGVNLAYDYDAHILKIDSNMGDAAYKDIYVMKSSSTNGGYALVHKDNPNASGKLLNETSYSFKNKKLLREFRKYLNLV